MATALPTATATQIYGGTGTAGLASVLTTLPAAAFPALTGDVTTMVGALATTLATVNANVGTFGSETQTPTFTVDGKGRLTAAGAVTPQFTSPYTGGTARNVTAKLGNIEVSAADVGIKCDSSTDDGPEIIAAANSLVSAGYDATIVFPYGICAIATTISLNSWQHIHFRGQGIGYYTALATFANDGDGTDFLWTGVSNGKIMEWNQSSGDATGVSLDGIVLDCNSSASYGLYALGAFNTHIDVKVRNCNTKGVYTDINLTSSLDVEQNDWRIIGEMVSTGALNADIFAIGPGSFYQDTHTNRFDVVGEVQNGNAVTCGQADSNMWTRIQVPTWYGGPSGSSGPTGSSKGVELQASAASNEMCRAEDYQYVDSYPGMYFDYTGGLYPAYDINIHHFVTQSAETQPTFQSGAIAGGATAFWENDNGQRLNQNGVAYYLTALAGVPGMNIPHISTTGAAPAISSCGGGATTADSSSNSFGVIRGCLETPDGS